ncbi:MAG: orotate phosphoribosyltransferase [Phycisphaerales bacterium JB063]
MTREQLIQRIADAALLRGEFTLRSGRKSKYYLDKYLFTTQPDILEALGKLFAQRLTDLPGGLDRIDRLAGTELGGIPLVSAAAIATGKPAILIRNQKKGYGTAKQLEGAIHPGETIVLLEDIATTGGQVLEAGTMLRDEFKVNIPTIIATIDREEGARENIEAAGFAFDALFTKSDLGIDE